MHETGPFSIPSIRSFVPEKLRPWIIIIFALIFQLSGGVYLAVVSEMVGSTSLMREDVTMAGAASLVGLALVFCVMFRLKFRFASKSTLLICCAGIIVCNLICMVAVFFSLPNDVVINEHTESINATYTLPTPHVKAFIEGAYSAKKNLCRTRF